MLGLAPLNALRAFEAAARRGSFAAAAQELHVTPAAVGQHVRQLEALIGAPLFDRVGRQLALTQRGAAALTPLQRGFELMGEASAALRESSGTRAITLAAPADLLACWLAADIASWAPVTPVKLVGLDARADADAGFGAGADLVLVRTSATQSAAPLMKEVLAPLASPSLSLTGDGLERLSGAVLIEDAPQDTGWARWASARGAYGADFNASIRAPDSLTALELAKAGAGILLARKPLALDAIRRGELIPVLPDGDLQLDAGYELFQASDLSPNAAVNQLALHLRKRASFRLDLSDEL